MAKTMTPSDKFITDGQIDKAAEAYRAMLKKHRAELGSEEAQMVLGQDDYINEQVGVLRRRIEAVSKMIVRRVDNVDRTKLPCEMLDATGRKQYVDRNVGNAMPHGTGEGAEVVFFQLGRYISDDDLEKEYASRGLIPADPYSQAAVNVADPAFADTHPNGTHWQDADGNWCYSTFRLWRGGERSVRVNRDDREWAGGWWFAGLRK